MSEVLTGDKAKRILEMLKEGKTPTEIMRATGFSMTWIREVRDRRYKMKENAQ